MGIAMCHFDLAARPLLARPGVTPPVCRTLSPRLSGRACRLGACDKRAAPVQEPSLDVVRPRAVHVEEERADRAPRP